jgi:hypothetical protein
MALVQPDALRPQQSDSRANAAEVVCDVPSIAAMHTAWIRQVQDLLLPVLQEKEDWINSIGRAIVRHSKRCDAKRLC